MPSSGNSASPPNASTTLRAETQRERILDAAQRCFIARGFHAAAVSEIASEAGISQGLMYRYFKNKRAMILALIERQLQSDLRAIQARPPTEGLVDGLLAIYRQWAKGEPIADVDAAIPSVALYAEITAEAQRDPVVADVLRRHDRLTTNAVCDWLRQHDAARGAAIDNAALRERTLLLRTTVEGLAMRAVRDPGLSPAIVRSVLSRVVAQVLGH